MNYIEENYQIRCQRCEKIKYNQPFKSIQTKLCDDCRQEMGENLPPLLMFVLILGAIMLGCVVIFSL